MRDGWQREIDYLRISVTDRCNLRCFYCMPAAGVPHQDHHQILTYEEIVRVVQLAATRGVRRLRLTGGEPLLRRDLEVLVARLASLNGVEEVSLTTNGLLLPQKIGALRQAGLGRVNISLDTLRPERYERLSGGGQWEQAWAGVEAALAWDLDPVKLNVVALKGLNDDEIADFTDLTRIYPLHVRFIELMPLGDQGRCSADYHLPLVEVERELARLGAGKAARVAGGGPARYFRLPGARGTVGLIRPLSAHFCRGCNRLRLTADGRLKPCLASPVEVDLRCLLRGSGEQEDLERAWDQALALKPLGHRLDRGAKGRKGRYMSEIGG